MKFPVTPDGRYFVVRGRLWRMANPALDPAERSRLQRELMGARSALGHARRSGGDDARRLARARIDAAKVALGERGPPWWADGAPDYNRRMAVNTPYRPWFEQLPPEPDSDPDPGDRP
ncbi:hypothetical protein AB1L88_12255 [Tautonia sp. JC769]|uniref:hypothetical protein n=1 Tax=Tautonia sp. JC769 TaxID=3232135 RepID=UPI003458C64A